MAATVRKDIFQTSTGTGHHYRPGYYFPDSNFKRTIGDDLPSELVCPPQNLIPTNERFTTTTGEVHDLKHTGGPFGNRDPYYKKAPGHWKIDYAKDLHEKLQPGGWRKPLSMGNQTSETHDRFRNEPKMPADVKEYVGPQGFNLGDHHLGGPSQKVYPTTTNEKMKGRPYKVFDKGVLDLNDPYLTTTNKVHRRFKPKELNGVAKKDVPTYWECEEYPKAWGHGLKHNPLPKASVPYPHPPMRDEMIFKSETRIRRIPPKTVHVPHQGLRSLSAETYQRPSDVKMKEIYYTPVDPPYLLPAPSTKSAMATPSMYNTEYQNVGSKKPITV